MLILRTCLILPWNDIWLLSLTKQTNNLDLESVAALAESVKNFEGAVICVSHDQFFVQSVANEAWVVNDGNVQQVESFEAYRKKQLKLLNKNSVWVVWKMKEDIV